MTTSTTETHCHCGSITGIECGWTGPRQDTVLVEYMPECWRSSHTAAGNYGVYPENGAIRARVSRECADMLTDGESEWTTIV